jgi:hypothetical protein
MPAKYFTLGQSVQLPVNRAVKILYVVTKGEFLILQ